MVTRLDEDKRQEDRQDDRQDKKEDLVLVGLTGSLRKGSYNRALLRAAQGLVGEGVRLDILDLADLPFFNEDLEKGPLPPAVLAFKKSLEKADGLLLASPEYNFSLPPVLKNALDWASRGPRKKTPLYGKPAAIMSASTGRLGGARVQYALRQVAASLNLHLVNQPEVFVAKAADKLDDKGELVHERTLSSIDRLLKALVEEVHLRKKTTNETLKTIFGRTSIRAYKPELPPASLLEKVAEAASFAPTALNDQGRIFRLVTSPDLLKDIRESAVRKLLDHPQAALREKAQSPGYDPFYGAPALLLISAKDASALPQKDALLAMENALLAAHSLGLGSCYINVIEELFAGQDNQTLKEKLDMGPGERLYAGAALGYPAAASQPKARTEKIRFF